MNQEQIAALPENLPATAHMDCPHCGKATETKTSSHDDYWGPCKGDVCTECGYCETCGDQEDLEPAGA